MSFMNSTVNEFFLSFFFSLEFCPFRFTFCFYKHRLFLTSCATFLDHNADTDNNTALYWQHHSCVVQHRKQMFTVMRTTERQNQMIITANRKLLKNLRQSDSSSLIIVIRNLTRRFWKAFASPHLCFKKLTQMQPSTPRSVTASDPLNLCYVFTSFLSLKFGSNLYLRFLRCFACVPSRRKTLGVVFLLFLFTPALLFLSSHLIPSTRIWFWFGCLCFSSPCSSEPSLFQEGL